MNRVRIFIDNSNIYKSLCEQQKIDSVWVKQYNPLFLAKVLAGKREIVGIDFYCTNPPSILRKRNPKAFKTQESYYTKVSKLEKVNIHFGTLTMNGGKYFEKNLDTQMAVDIVEGAYLNQYDTLILVSSDGDFESCIRKVKNIGKKVEILFFKGNISQNLKKLGDINRKARKSYFKKL